MKKLSARVVSILLMVALVLSFLPAAVKTEVHAATRNQKNIVDRANYLYNTTWVCQKTVAGWRDQYYFTKGETYRIPYGQPIYSGYYIGFGVEVDTFVAAAADASSIFYSGQSEYNNWTSTYYATDCSAYVSWCWGTSRYTTYSIPLNSTNMGAATESNIYGLQLGDALNSNSAGHVVLVTDLTYDANGTLTQIEITEQTPPQLKRSYYTPATLAAKYAAEYTIQRYTGTVPEAPSSGYVSSCTEYAAHCKVEVTVDSSIMSLPCTAAVDGASEKLGTAAAGETYTVIGLYKNTLDQWWYALTTSSGEEGYVPAENAAYLEEILSDITLTGATAPNGHVKGNIFYVKGTISAQYQKLTSVAVYVHDGFGINGTTVTGSSATVSGNSYTLTNSAIDNATSFGDVPLSNHTYAISADYKNYYISGGELVENTGRVYLMESYFVVISSSVNQSTCSHSYKDTTLVESTCLTDGAVVHACSTCGLVNRETVEAKGHAYGDWTTEVEVTCTTDGLMKRTCTACGNVESKTVTASGHSFTASGYESNCQQYEHTEYICGNCGDSYNTYPDALMSPWQETKPEGVDESLIETGIQYRYSDYETTTSYETALEGYTLKSSAWVKGDTGTVNYVKSWPTGFLTTNSLYSQYNNQSKKVTASETETAKVTVDSDARAGYLWYHWCGGGQFSTASKTASYTNFHAFYSETLTPANAEKYDSSDGSYKHSTATGCSTCVWYWPIEVYAQSYTNYQKQFTYERWGDFSQWSNVVCEESDTRKVETRTVYRYVTAELDDHSWSNGSCTVCGKVCTHNYTNGTCTVCGAADPDYVPVVNPTITPAFPTMALEEEVKYNIYFTVSDLGDYTVNDMGLLVFDSKVANPTYDTAKSVVPGATISDGYFMVQSGGIPAKEMADDPYFVIYIKLADGSYAYSMIFTFNAVDYVQSVLASSAYPEGLKKTCVALMNYGADAQVYFGYKTDSLMNSFLTADQQAMVSEYNSSMVSSIVKADASKVGEFASVSGGFSNIVPSVSLEGAFAVNYYFIPGKTVESDMTFYCWDAKTYNSVDVLTKENAINAETLNVNDAGQYLATFEGIAAKDLDSTVYVAAVYESNGVTYCTGVLAVSVSVLSTMQMGSDANLTALAEGIIVYGDCAKAYFSN